MSCRRWCLFCRYVFWLSYRVCRVGVCVGVRVLVGVFLFVGCLRCLCTSSRILGVLFSSL